MLIELMYHLLGRYKSTKDSMARPRSIAEFIRAIEALPSDEPTITPGKWYTTQKEHWLGWLREYNGPGAYHRASTRRRDAQFAYNHIVEPKMLLWLIEASGIQSEVVNAAQQHASRADSMMQKSAAIRRQVPWSDIETVLWGTMSREHV